MSHQPDNIFAGTQVVSLVELPWAEVDAWRGRCRAGWQKELHRDFERALAETKLPERPDYDLPRRCASTAGAAKRFLVKARREMAEELKS